MRWSSTAEGRPLPTPVWLTVIAVGTMTLLLPLYRRNAPRPRRAEVITDSTTAVLRMEACTVVHYHEAVRHLPQIPSPHPEEDDVRRTALDWLSADHAGNSDDVTDVPAILAALGNPDLAAAAYDPSVLNAVVEADDDPFAVLGEVIMATWRKRRSKNPLRGRAFVALRDRLRRGYRDLALPFLFGMQPNNRTTDHLSLAGSWTALAGSLIWTKYVTTLFLGRLQHLPGRSLAPAQTRQRNSTAPTYPASYVLRALVNHTIFRLLELLVQHAIDTASPPIRHVIREALTQRRAVVNAKVQRHPQIVVIVSESDPLVTALATIRGHAAPQDVAVASLFHLPKWVVYQPQDHHHHMVRPVTAQTVSLNYDERRRLFPHDHRDATQPCVARLGVAIRWDHLQHATQWTSSKFCASPSRFLASLAKKAARHNGRFCHLFLYLPDASPVPIYHALTSVIRTWIALERVTASMKRKLHPNRTASDTLSELWGAHDASENCRPQNAMAATAQFASVQIMDKRSNGGCVHVLPLLPRVDALFALLGFIRPLGHVNRSTQSQSASRCTLRWVRDTYIFAVAAV